MSYRSTKTYGHDLGLSACFRQWKADSHCAQLHGYALAFSLVFEADHLDERNWVMDFGALKPIRYFLEDTFDHQTLVASDDPELPRLRTLHDLGVLKLKLVRATGCEAFAKLVFDFVIQWLADRGYAPRVRLVSVECREHGANSAIYSGVGS